MKHFCVNHFLGYPEKINFKEAQGPSHPIPKFQATQHCFLLWKEIEDVFGSPKQWGSSIPEAILTAKTILLTIRKDTATCSWTIWPLKGFAFPTWDLPHPAVAISCASQKDRGLGVPFYPLEEESKQQIRKWKKMAVCPVNQHILHLFHLWHDLF